MWLLFIAEDGTAGFLDSSPRLKRISRNSMDDMKEFYYCYGSLQPRLLCGDLFGKDYFQRSIDAWKILDLERWVGVASSSCFFVFKLSGLQNGEGHILCFYLRRSMMVTSRGLALLALAKCVISYAAIHLISEEKNTFLGDGSCFRWRIISISPPEAIFSDRWLSSETHSQLKRCFPSESPARSICQLKRSTRSKLARIECDSTVTAANAWGRVKRSGGTERTVLTWTIHFLDSRNKQNVFTFHMNSNKEQEQRKRRYFTTIICYWSWAPIYIRDWTAVFVLRLMCRHLFPF